MLNVSLPHATSNGGNLTTSYPYSLNAGRWVKVATRASASFRVSHLVPAKKYSVRLRAINVVGTGATSRAECVTVA